LVAYLPSVVNKSLADMAKSRFEYVRNFELPDPLLQGTYIVVRVDGRGFHKYVDPDPELSLCSFQIL
jgi:hypothetical protein